MSNAKIEEAILQAIDIIADKKIKSAEYDKTIQAIIVSCEDETIGKYKIKYQDSLFFAYSENTNVTYSKGTSVYILVPNGDMTKDKTILGATKKLGTNYINNIENYELYEPVGTNIIQIKSGKQNYGQLCSYSTDTKMLYDIDSSYLNNSILFNKNMVTEYFKQSSSFSISFDVKTNLNIRQRYQGDYGVTVALDFIDPTDTTENAYITRYFTLNIDKMTGNPYSYQTNTTQQAYFEINGENFLRIRSISLFIKNFPLQENNKPADIFISNLSLYGANKFSTEDLNGCFLTLLTPKGYIFNETVLNDEDKKLINRPIQAELRVKGKKVDTSIQPVEFYWFVQNLSVTSGSSYYNKYGGEGWKCINSYNILSEQDVRNHIPAVYSFLPGTNSLTVTLYDVIAKVTKYKCVAVYNQNVYSKEISIINNNSNYNIIIDSQEGEDFFNDEGFTNLICKCLIKTDQTTEDDEIVYQEESIDKLKFIWGVVNSTGNFEFLDESSLTYEIQNNIISNILIKNISKFAIFKCSVFDKNTNTFLGTASINLNNILQDQPPVYTLVINNGSQIFKYDTHGISPTSEKNEKPLQITNLTFTLYNQKGEIIQHKYIDPQNISWIVPNKDTLLQINYNDQGEIIPDQNEIPKYKVYHTEELSYTIQNYYNINYTNNNIELQINYQNHIVKAYTNFTFIKDGDAGTNGTDYVCKIMPNAIASTKIPTYPTIYWDGTKVFFNWQINTKSNGTPVNDWFIAELWQNGEKIFSGSKSGQAIGSEKFITVVNWEVLKNLYSYDVEDSTNFQIQVSQSQENWNFQLKDQDKLGTSDWRPANIIKVTLSYENNIYYATLPVNICRIWNTENSEYTIKLKEDSGFNHVLYTSAGNFPSFSNNNIFEIEVINNNEDEINNFSYEWYYNGSIKYQNNYSWTDDKEITYQDGSSSGKWLQKSNLLNSLKPNQKAIKPVETYDGQCVNTGLICKIFNNLTLIGCIYIPIHMLRNRFENSAINGWDGNSVELGGSNGGMILAPQVGAGMKNNNNQFTGVFMGIAKDPSANSAASKNEDAQDIGLFGYAEGSRSIFLDAKTGKAIFGEKEKGQIIIDPGDTNIPAVIRSGNYNYDSSSDAGAGMEINLSGTQGGEGPWIKFGSGNFEVDKNGHIMAKGGGKIAGWEINDYQISNAFDIIKNGNVVSYGLTGMNGIRQLLLNSSTGEPRLDENGAPINGARVERILVPPTQEEGAENGYRSVWKTIAFWAEESSQYGTNAFRVTHDGWMISRKACIGNGNKPIFIGGTGNNSYIFSGLKNTINANADGFYLGTNGIGIGPLVNDQNYSVFQVNSKGVLHASNGYFSGEIQTTKGKIGGWSIGQNYISNEIDLSTSNGIITKSRITLGSGANENHDILVVRHRKVYASSGQQTDDSPTYPFWIRATGEMHAERGSIGGWNIKGDGLFSNTITDKSKEDQSSSDEIPNDSIGSSGVQLDYTIKLQSKSRKCFYVSTSRGATKTDVIAMQVKKSSNNSDYYYNGNLLLANNYNTDKITIDSESINLTSGSFSHSISQEGKDLYMYVGSGTGSFVVRSGVNTNWLIVEQPPGFTNAEQQLVYPSRTVRANKDYDAASKVVHMYQNFSEQYGDIDNFHQICERISLIYNDLQEQINNLRY